MTIVPDEYRLEDITRAHAIGAGLFLPLTIARLSEVAGSTEALFTVSLRDVGQPGIRQRQLRLYWSAASQVTQPLGVPERVITEWAACGVACAVLALYTDLRIRQVTGDGDRFDYWVGAEQHEYGLEVSGTLTEEVAARHRLKVNQLLANPYAVDGYVVVAGFATHEIIFSFHHFAATF